MPNASYAARQPPAVEGEKPVHVLVTGFGVSVELFIVVWCICGFGLRGSIAALSVLNLSTLNPGKFLSTLRVDAMFDIGCSRGP